MQFQTYLRSQSPPFSTDEQSSSDSDGAASRGSAWSPPAFVNLPTLNLKETSHTGGYQQSYPDTSPLSGATNTLTGANYPVNGHDSFLNPGIAASYPRQYDPTESQLNGFSGYVQPRSFNDTFDPSDYGNGQIIPNEIPATWGWPVGAPNNVSETVSTFTKAETPSPPPIAAPNASILPSQNGKPLCPTCKKPFAKPSNVKRHLNTVHHKEFHFCEHRGCFSYYGRSDHLKAHQDTHKKPVQNGSFKCPACGLTFTTKGALAKHHTFCQGR